MADNTNIVILNGESVDSPDFRSGGRSDAVSGEPFHAVIGRARGGDVIIRVLVAA